MKNLPVSKIKRVLIAFALYFCCNTVFCCSASMQTEPKKQDAKEVTSGYNKHSLDEELTPMHLITLHISSLLQ